MTLTEAPSVLGVDCLAGDLEAAACAVVTRGQDGLGGYACFCNVHVLVLAQHRPDVRRALAEAWAVFPDGAPVAWLQRRIGAVGAARLGGPDLMPLVFDRGRIAGLRHYLLGSTADVRRRCEQELLHLYPGARIVGTGSIPFDDSRLQEDPRLLADIRNTAPDLVWVGLGAPKQELWMHKNAASLAPALALGVGAAFDFIAGTKPRAPSWMRSSGLEWLHRLSLEPRRLTGRYVRTNGEFVVRASIELLRPRVAPTGGRRR
jgi:N-acetylglucosaminyldiphosphoundecaprenol N-acetyl-beta-D-mannosaminyltransferase